MHFAPAQISLQASTYSQKKHSWRTLPPALTHILTVGIKVFPNFEELGGRELGQVKVRRLLPFVSHAFPLFSLSVPLYVLENPGRTLSHGDARCQPPPLRVAGAFKEAARLRFSSGPAGGAAALTVFKDPLDLSTGVHSTPSALHTHILTLLA